VVSARLLLLDACVLIDFATSDLSVLTLVTAHIGQVHVPSPVFDEVEQAASRASPTTDAFVCPVKRRVFRSYGAWNCSSN